MKPDWRAIFLLIGILVVGWWSYRPGLAGGFLFDDFKNLDGISNYGTVRDFQSLLLYVTSGDADPTGRPLSLLSFLIDANEWPADPESFKRTNILLHLLNGLLLSWTLLRLGRHLNLTESHAATAGILAALLWTFHPLWVSTTLYVVQRQAMLAATFSLLGILLWIIGRERLETSRPAGISCLVVSACLCTVLAVLSKGNGILLPLLILIVDRTALATGSTTLSEIRVRRWRLALLVLPSILIAAWLSFAFFRAMSSPSPGLPWSIWQRFITEPRALLSYLGLLWIPRGSLFGLFNDDYPVSSDLFRPWSTFPSIMAVAILVTIGINSRRSHRALSLSILFFFGGHLVESSVIPLELYFEHRNYLPAMPAFWPLAIWLTADNGFVRRLRLALVVALPCALAILTQSRAVIWGNPYLQAVLFAEASPHSYRAQVSVGYYHLKYGHPALAVGQLLRTVSEFPEEPAAALHLVEAECTLGAVTPEARDKLVYALQHNKNAPGLVHYWMGSHIDLAASASCRGFNLAFMERMLLAVRENPYFSSDDPMHRRNVEYMEGRLALARNDVETAFWDFNRSLAEHPALDQALHQSTLLGESRRPELGLAHLAYFETLPLPPAETFKGMPSVHAWLLDHFRYWPTQRSELEAKLKADAVALKRSAQTPLP